MKKSEALGLLTRMLDGLPSLPADEAADGPEFQKWRRGARVALERVFGKGSSQVEEFTGVNFSPMVVRSVRDPSAWARLTRAAQTKGLTEAGSLLESMRAEIGDHWPDDTAGPEHPSASSRRLLLTLHEIYRRQGHRNWSVTADESLVRESGLSIDELGRAFARLADKGLARQVTVAGAFSIEPAGVDAAEDPSLLDDLLPVPGAKSPSAGPAVDRPVTDLMSGLDFVGEHDEQLREVIVADIRELDGAIAAGLHKTTMLLCGSILEGVLLDVLDRRRDLAGPYLKKGRKFPDDASLDDLLTIAADDELIGNGRALLSSTTKSMGHAIKEHRDLIHPHRQIRERVKVDLDAAGGMVALLRLVVRDLRAAAESGVIQEYEKK